MRHNQITWEESEEYFSPTYCWKAKEGIGIVDMVRCSGRGKKRCAGGNYISSSSDDPVGPEKALLCAVIERAARDLFEDNQEVSLEAKRWFSNFTSTEEFSFAWICEQLGYDQSWFLSKLIPFVAEGLGKDESEGLRALREIGME